MTGRNHPSEGDSVNDEHLDSLACPPTVRAWVSADRRLDLITMREQLAADVELISPLTDGFAFMGPRDVMSVFESVFELLEDIEIAALTGAGDNWVLHGTNTLHGNNLEEIQWLELDEYGLIRKITLFIRPMPAAVTLLSMIGGPLAERGALRKSAGAASKAAGPLAFLLRATERYVMPRLGRKR